MLTTMRSDRLSALPENIVSCILSLMPTIYAMRTSILSKRWRYSWMFITNLDFDDHNHPNFDKISFSKFVDRVLESCKLPQVKSFRLNLSSSTVSQYKFSKWIDEAVRLNVCELDIQFLLHTLPVNILTCKTLTKLRISNVCPDFSDLECPCLINLPCLKTLDIVVFKLPFINVLKLIRGCPVLEVLSLEVICSKGEEDFMSNIPTLKQLKRTLTYNPNFVSKTVALNESILEYLFLSGYQCSFFVNLSSLIEAYVSFSDLKSNDRLFGTLKGFIGVTSFQVESFHTLKFPTGSPSSWPIFPNLEHLELKGFQDFEIINLFLESSPQLEHLCFRNSYRSYMSFKNHQHIKHGESSWIYPKSVPACMLTNLTTVKFFNFNGEKCDTQFLEYLLENAKVLKTLTLTWDNLRVEKRMQLIAHALLEIPRASRYCEIHLPYTFSLLGERKHF